MIIKVPFRVHIQRCCQVVCVCDDCNNTSQSVNNCTNVNYQGLPVYENITQNIGFNPNPYDTYNFGNSVSLGNVNHFFSYPTLKSNASFCTF